MAVRVRVKIRATDTEKEILSTALLNSGFETDSPQVILPVAAAEMLGLYPFPQSVRIIELGTAGGPARMYLLPKAIEISIVTEDRKCKAIKCDAIVSPIEEEILINDKLMDCFNIVILKAGVGVWKFADDPPDKERKSVQPEYW